MTNACTYLFSIHFSIFSGAPFMRVDSLALYNYGLDIRIAIGLSLLMDYEVF